MRRALIAVIGAVLLLSQVALPHVFGQVIPPYVNITPDPAPCGGNVTVSGGNWPTGATLTVKIVELPSVQPVTAQAAFGSFNVQLFIPQSVQSGVYTVSVAIFNGSTPPVTKQLTITCGASAPSISVTPTQVPVNSQVTVQGTGFIPNSTVAVVIGPAGGLPVAHQNVQTSASGTFFATFYIPSTAPPGQYVASAEIGTTTPITANFQVTSAAQITSLLPNPVSPGGTVTVRASGLQPSASTTVSIVNSFGQPIASQTFQTDIAGNLFANIAVPQNAAPGTYTVTVQTGSNPPVSAPLQIAQRASISVSPSAIAAGGTITVNGTGFTPGSTVTLQVVVTTNGGGQQNVTVNANVSALGTFSQGLAIPGATVPGVYTIGAYAGIGGAPLATTRFTVTSAATIELDPSVVAPANVSGAGCPTPGQGCTDVYGTGFAPGETVVISYTANNSQQNQPPFPVTVTTLADFEGDVTATIPVPVNVSAAQSYTVTATGQQSGRSASTTLRVSLDPQIFASPTTVNAGGSVTITCQSFPTGAGGNPVSVTATVPLSGGATQTITANGIILADRVCRSSANGPPGIIIPIPSNAVSGPITFTATAQGPTSGQTYTASTTVIVASAPASLSVNPTSATAGSQVIVSGANFGPGPGNLVTIVVTFPTSAGIRQFSNVVDVTATGTFQAVVSIPDTAVGGTAVITAHQPGSDENASATLPLQPAAPTATPVPTSTTVPTNTPVPPTNTPVPPTNTPVPPTATPIPPTPTPTPQPKMHVKKITVTWPTVRRGTYNNLHVQANQGGNISVTVTVTWPNGSTQQFKGSTHGHSTFNLTISIPTNVGTGVAKISVRLQKGKRGVTGHISFNVI